MLWDQVSNSGDRDPWHGLTGGPYDRGNLRAPFGKEGETKTKGGCETRRVGSSKDQIGMTLTTLNQNEGCGKAATVGLQRTLTQLGIFLFQGEGS
jgi:hypothetical protein